MPFALDDASRVEAQYRDAGKLNARVRLHAKYTVEEEPFYAFIRRQIALSPGERLLECGAGDGALWAGARFPPGARLTLTDISPGMVEALRKRFAAAPEIIVQAADVARLPFEDGAFQVAVADHMLYHVPDMDGAINQLARVLAPGGRLIASTMSEDSYPQLWRAAGEKGPQLKFTLENGAEALSRAFSRVSMRVHPAHLRVTDANDAVAYVESLVSLTEARKSAMLARVNKEIQTQGYFRVDKRAGLFVCEK